jgi:hypothetical protein
MICATILLMIKILKRLYNFFGRLLSILIVANIVIFVVILIDTTFSFYDMHFTPMIYGVSRILIQYLMVVICIAYFFMGISKLIIALTKKEGGANLTRARFLILRAIIGIFVTLLLLSFYSFVLVGTTRFSPPRLWPISAVHPRVSF